MLALIAHALERAIDFARRQPLDAIELGTAWAAAVVALVLLILSR